MKNFTKAFVVGALLLPSLAEAQTYVGTTPTNRNAVVEEWTGIHCGYCPIGHATVNQQIASNPGRVVAINIHAGGYAVPGAGEPDFRTSEGNALDAAFPISGYPASTLNREAIYYNDQQDGWVTRQVYHPAYLGDASFIPNILTEVSPVNVYVSATIDVQTRELVVTTEYYYTSNAPAATNYMNVAITQNEVHGPQTDYGDYNPSGWVDQAAGIYNHNHVLRDMATGTWGDPITTTTAGSTLLKTYTQILPVSIAGVDLDISNIEIAAYISQANGIGGTVLSGSSAHATLINFTSSDEVIFQDASVADILTCTPTVDQTVTPKTTIQNFGSNTMTSATITYDVNGGTPVVFNWSGSIAPGASSEITLNPITFTPQGTNTLNVAVSNPNGVADNTADNAGSTVINIDGPTQSSTIDVTVNILPDNYGSETTWNIKDGSGTTVASGGTYTDGNTTPIAVPVTLPNAVDCYTFTINDSYGDGICCSYGTGSYNITDGSSNVLLSGGEFGSTESKLFATNLSGITELGVSEVKVYPNPANDVVNVTFDSENDAIVSLTDFQGRVLSTETGMNKVSFNVSELAAGTYMVTINSGKGNYTQTVVVK